MACLCSVSLSNVGSLAVEAFNLVNCSLSVVGFVPSLKLVSKCRNVVVGLWATQMLWGCRILEMVSEVPLMLGMVTVVTGVGFLFVASPSVGR